MILKFRAWQCSASRAHKTEDTQNEITHLSVKHIQITKLITIPATFFQKQIPTAK
jgi:hypothetical protein